ncbi:MAG: hypothetical protein ACYTG1_01420 [Planctomycetota bacterium]
MLVAAAGCNGGGDEPEAAGGDADWAAALPPTAPYEGPPAELTLETGPGWTQFRWAVTVPTGGWSLTFKRSSYRTNDHGTILVLLTRPGPDEMVTQAQERLEGDYRHGKIAFDRADLQVAIVTRGEHVEYPEFRRAATWP